MVRKKILASVVMAVASLLPAVVQAGGLSLYEIATADVGLASAGWAARAQDPSTLLKNPAGMSLLEGNQFQGGAQLLQGGIAFSPSAGTSVDGNSGGNPVGVLPGFEHVLRPWPRPGLQSGTRRLLPTSDSA